MKQLNFRDMFKPMQWKELDDNKRKSASESHTFFNKNRDGKIQGTTSIW